MKGLSFISVRIPLYFSNKIPQVKRKYKRFFWAKAFTFRERGYQRTPPYSAARRKSSMFSGLTTK
jgi:hypothetical protein